MMSHRYLGLLFVVISVINILQPPDTFTAAATASLEATPHVDVADGIDLSHLPLGDGKLSDSPRVGWIWPCHIEATAGGAGTDGPWINKTNGTYDLSRKAVVAGSVNWPQHKLTVTIADGKRVISSNDLPDHSTGVFPIARTDKAYLYDRNPSKIATQNMVIELPATPALAAQPSCAPGAVGVLLSGSVLFNALDAPGRDAVAHEAQDSCQGHPMAAGVYHYHSLTSCLPDTTSADGQSTLVGYALDGFGIYGRRGVGGKILSSADLDECHGQTSEIEWDGKMVVMYHYVATWDFPYTIGCMRGIYKMSDVMTISGTPNGAGAPAQAGGTGQNQQNSGNGQPSGQPDLVAAAAKLGISVQTLRDALGPPPPNLSAAAAKLGITEQALREALGLGR